jgi:GNAT superfamily N-acetyltransferase
MEGAVAKSVAASAPSIVAAWCKEVGAGEPTTTYTEAAGPGGAAVFTCIVAVPAVGDAGVTVHASGTGKRKKDAHGAAMLALLERILALPLRGPAGLSRGGVITPSAVASTATRLTGEGGASGAQEAGSQLSAAAAPGEAPLTGGGGAAEDGDTSSEGTATSTTASAGGVSEAGGVLRALLATVQKGVARPPAAPSPSAGGHGHAAAAGARLGVAASPAASDGGSGGDGRAPGRHHRRNASDTTVHSTRTAVQLITEDDAAAAGSGSVGRAGQHEASTTPAPAPLSLTSARSVVVAGDEEPPGASAREVAPAVPASSPVQPPVVAAITPTVGRPAPVSVGPPYRSPAGRAGTPASSVVAGVSPLATGSLGGGGIGAKGAMQPTPVSAEFRTAVENAVRVAAALFTAKPLSFQVVKSVHSSQQFMRVAFHWAAAYTNELRRQFIMRTGSSVPPVGRGGAYGSARAARAPATATPTAAPTPSPALTPAAAGDGGSARRLMGRATGARARDASRGAGAGRGGGGGMHGHRHGGPRFVDGAAPPSDGRLGGWGGSSPTPPPTDGRLRDGSASLASDAPPFAMTLASRHDVHTCTAYLPTLVAREDGFVEHAMQPFPVAVLVTPEGSTVLHTLPALPLPQHALPGLGERMMDHTAAALPSPAAALAGAEAVVGLAAAMAAAAVDAPCRTEESPLAPSPPRAVGGAATAATPVALSPAPGDGRPEGGDAMDNEPAVPLPLGWSGCVLDHCQLRVAGLEDMEAVWAMVRELAAFEREPDGVKTTPESYARDGCSAAPLFHAMLVEVPVALYEAMAPPPATGAPPRSDAPGAGGATHSMWGDWRPVAMAFCHLAYSTWEGRVLYLEDLYVAPRMRRHGLSQLLFECLARAAHVAHCARMQWSVLNWNAAARRLYEHPRIGATALSEWGLYRLNRGDLARIAQLDHALLDAE